MSGPLEELRAAMDAYDSGSWEVVADATADIVAAARALLAASGTGERPADERLDRAVSLVRRMRAQHHRTGSYAASHLIAGVDDFLSTIPRAPTPPDAGTGTPSDDGRVDWIIEALASRYSMTARTGPWSEGFRDGLSAAMQYARRATPAAPSGTTGATTGGESPYPRGKSMCPHCAALFPPCDLTPIHGDTQNQGEACPGSQQTPRDPVSDRRTLWSGQPNPHASQPPPSTGAESRDDR